MKHKFILPVVFTRTVNTSPGHTYNNDLVIGFMGKVNDFYPITTLHGVCGRVSKMYKSDETVFINVAKKPVNGVLHAYASTIKNERTIIKIKPHGQN